ncbi:hypothetical protein FJY94_07315 [Candidatus Kaiserbacteria bacterium]|nr:hypothetical protein [Candidatus Kaiserbacteria bacterium]
MTDKDADWQRVLEADEQCKRTYSKWQEKVALELHGECSCDTVDAYYDLWRHAMNDAVALRGEFYRRHARQDQQPLVDDPKRSSAGDA